MALFDYVQDNILVLDGGLGTMLQDRGLAAGENPESFNMTAPEIVKAIHAAYLEAGADMITANTFGANAHKLCPTGYRTAEVIHRAVTLAKEAAAPYGRFVALDIGPIGELLEPMGTLRFEEAYGLFKEQVIAGVEAGADAICIETMTDLYEAKCAVLAAKENSDLPVFCTLSFEENGHTFVGTGLSSMALTLEGLGVDFLGINCSLGPTQIIPMVEELLRWTNRPLVIQPNAGLPCVVDGKTVFDVGPEAFSEAMDKMLQLGVGAVGGCCGTTPEHIRRLKAIAQNYRPKTRTGTCPVAVCSGLQTVAIDRVRMVGERINPTGKKAFQEALRRNDLDYMVTQAIEQVEAGADILDVNVGLPGIDEKAMMVRVIKTLQGIIKAPLQIDSSHPEVLEAALRVYNGKAIVNSVNAEDRVLDRILPLVKKYGAAVVGLTLDEGGIPRTAEERLRLAQKIVARAGDYGIPKADVFIDCLTLTASAEQAIAYETLRAVSLVKQNLGVKTLLGVSNISFGLPAREKMNQVFLSAALAHGLDLPIINPNVTSMVDTVCCFHQLANHDENSRAYLARFADTASQAPPSQEPSGRDIGFYIRMGLKAEAKSCCRALLRETDGLRLTQEVLIPILDDIGRQYETGQIFLPQLLQSAEAAKAAFELVRQSIAARPGGPAEAAKRIVMATVKGDIHDIGKNIVKVVLENYGFEVLDLGRDVPVERVVTMAAEYGARLIGLSALMTTTLPSMEATIRALKAADPSLSVMVGGAVLTPEYARELGADHYGKDAMAAVAIAKAAFSETDET